MITKEKLDRAIIDNDALVFHNFTLLANQRNKNHIFCFYEGRDAPYYSLRIKRLTDLQYHNFKCGNKAKVLKTYFKIKNYITKYKIFFFVDKDFDDDINVEHIYETSTYSIENFYVDVLCIKEILKNEFSLLENEKEFKEIIDLFINLRDEYCDTILLFNSWYCALKRKKKEEGLTTTNVSLDDKLPKGFINLNFSGIERKYDLAKIRGKFPNAIRVEDDEVFKIFDELKNKELYKVLRGKFLIHFLINFIEHLVHDSKNEKKYIKSNINISINKVSIISHLSQYALTPKCLVDYLLKNLN